MSVIFSPSPSYYEAPDIGDDDQDDAVCPPELLTAGWWSASMELADLD